MILPKHFPTNHTLPVNQGPFKILGGSFRGKFRKFVRKTAKAVKSASKSPVFNNDILKSIAKNTFEDVISPALDTALGPNADIIKNLAVDVVKDAGNAKNLDSFLKKQTGHLDDAFGDVIQNQVEQLAGKNVLELGKDIEKIGKNKKLLSDVINKELGGGFIKNGRRVRR